MSGKAEYVLYDDEPKNSRTNVSRTGVPISTVVGLVVAVVALCVAGFALSESRQHGASCSPPPQSSDPITPGRQALFSLIAPVISANPVCTANTKAWAVCTDVIMHIGAIVLPTRDSDLTSAILKDKNVSTSETEHTAGFSFADDGTILEAHAMLNLTTGKPHSLSLWSNCSVDLEDIFCLKIQEGGNADKPAVTFLFNYTATVSPSEDTQTRRRRGTWKQSVWSGVTKLGSAVYNAFGSTGGKSGNSNTNEGQSGGVTVQGDNHAPITVNNNNCRCNDGMTTKQ